MNKPLNVLFLLPDSWGGAENVSVLTAHLLSGYQSINPILFTKKEIQQSKLNVNIPPENIEFFRPIIHLAIIDFISVCIKRQIDIVVPITETSLLVCCLIAKLLVNKRIKILYVCHNTLSMRYMYKTIRSLLNKVMMPVLLAKSDLIIAVSGGVKKDLVFSFRVKSNKILTIYNPVSFSQELGASKAAYPFLDKMTTLQKQGCKAIIFSGRLEVQKNPFKIIKLLQDLVNHDINCHLFIAGNGSLKVALQKYVNLVGISHHITFAGSLDRSELLEMLRLANLFVLTSFWEGFPTVLVEACVVNCPVLAVDCPSGPSEIAKIFNKQFLVPPNDDGIQLFTRAKDLLAESVPTIEIRRSTLIPTELTYTHIRTQYIKAITLLGKS